MREAAETIDDVEMLLRIFERPGVGELSHQAQRFPLVGDILAMLEGQIGELAMFFGQAFTQFWLLPQLVMPPFSISAFRRFGASNFPSG